MVKKLVILVALSALAGCGSDAVSRTELVLVADTDIASLDTIQFSITGPEGRVKTAKAAAGARSPGSRSVGLLHDGGKLGPFTLTATGLDQDGVLLSRTARVSFVEGKTLVVPLHLVASCIGVVCDKAGEQQCTERGCEAATLPSSKLESWKGKAPGLSKKPRDDGAMPIDAGATDAGEPVQDAGPDTSTPLPDGGIVSCGGEAVDLRTDDLHCGSCDKGCVMPAAKLHAENHCVNGKCVLSCLPHFADCDGNPTSGCETDMRADKHCKTCSNECKGGRRCVDGVCVK